MFLSRPPEVETLATPLEQRMQMDRTFVFSAHDTSTCQCSSMHFILFNDGYDIHLVEDDHHSNKLVSFSPLLLQSLI